MEDASLRLFYMVSISICEVFKSSFLEAAAKTLDTIREGVIIRFKQRMKSSKSKRFRLIKMRSQ